MIENTSGMIDVFMRGTGIKNIEPIENENWRGQIDLIMNENLKMETYLENERKFVQQGKAMNDIGSLINQIENEN